MSSHVQPHSRRDAAQRLLAASRCGRCCCCSRCSSCMPLYVMLTTSLKDMDADPRRPPAVAADAARRFDAWAKAWCSACTGVDCGGLKPFFMNSVLMVVPAVLVSTAIGAVNGYVLSKWRFRGSETMFALLLFGVFMPMQVVLLPMSAGARLARASPARSGA